MAGSEPNKSDSSLPRLEIGILTRGKPTLAMALSSLLLQENQNISIHVVDTSERPVVKQEDFATALRLAFDRNVPCTYEHNRDRSRPFSTGRKMLLEALSGSNVVFMDDDIVVPGGWLRELTGMMRQNPEYGFLAPAVKNAGSRRTALKDALQFSPGSLFRQDPVVRQILLDYYSSTTDVLDRNRGNQPPVWEIAFMTELFTLLGRPRLVQSSNLVYHLDYRATPNWDLLDEELVRTSKSKALELVQKHSSTRQGTSWQPAPAAPR